jgi:hypothetical protein
MKKRNRGAAKLRAIVRKAKSIRRKNPGKKWLACIRAAAKKV